MLPVSAQRERLPLESQAGVYRERELNLRIKPRKRIVREKPEQLAVAEAISHGAMDILHDQLLDGRSLRLFKLIDLFNRAKPWRWISTCHCRLSGPLHFGGLGRELLREISDLECCRRHLIDPGADAKLTQSSSLKSEMRQRVRRSEQGQ